MNFNTAGVRSALHNLEFEDLFIEYLGWDSAHGIAQEVVEIDGCQYAFLPVAQKRGLVVFICPSTNEIPTHAIRRKLDRRVAEKYREHFIIFVNGLETRQVWQWVLREPGRPLIMRTHEYRRGQPGDSLIQKLQAVAFDLQEEDTLNVVEVSGRLRAAFNVEQATKRFYDRFKSERNDFEGFISGIDKLETKREYVSVMLNRLMFIYFIQKKGFLDEDIDYLRNRMSVTRKHFGDDRFYSFYRYFLLRLFHEGLGSIKRDPALEELIGDVPYLNGGIFELHKIEQEYSDIQIPDSAFEHVLDFFDQYQWHLDDRPLRDDNEINPDVLGYIFEKYINQKQMGAYYTKEDITEYIGKNTIIPYLFDTAQKEYPGVFSGEDSVWILLQADPRRYIYPAVQKGVDLTLPDEIAVGIEDISRRDGWNVPAPEKYALPTEIWREVIARRQHYAEVNQKLVNGEIKTIEDLITYNLDIIQFAQDAIEICDQPETIRAFWNALTNITVLDPTCGSGAFLFAALNILHPLYHACLEQMLNFLNEPTVNDQEREYKDFSDIITTVAKHPNQEYFVLKSIIVDNLYGVDIMPEAAEIAKLRLFLKLSAQIEPNRNRPNWGIEPLPDIDFNIRTGNTLVGFSTREEVRKAILEVEGKGGGRQSKLLLTQEETDVYKHIVLQASEIDQLYQEFKKTQSGIDLSDYSRGLAKIKTELHNRLNGLGEELNKALALQYGIDTNDQESKDQWLASHHPFHWFIEFYGIINNGGFDVIIGNPPYVEYSKVRDEYSIKRYLTEDCGNLYAFIMERNDSLIKEFGYSGMIVPHSAFCTDRMSSLIKLIRRDSSLWLSTYDIRPSKLFVGVDQRLAIYFMKKSGRNVIYSSKYNRWHEIFRPYLFTCLEYVDVTSIVYTNSIPKAGKKIEIEIWNKISTNKSANNYLFGPKSIYFHNAPRYWIRAMTFAPYFWNERDGEKISTQMKKLNLSTVDYADTFTACLNSSLFYWWFNLLSDSRHLNLREIQGFPLSIDSIDRKVISQLGKLTKKLMRNYRDHSVRKVTVYKTTGKVIYDEFYPRYAKEIIDEIDGQLSLHFVLAPDEFDFIKNIDIKFRMGSELLNNDED